MTEREAKLEGWRAEILTYLLGCPSSKESIHRLPEAVGLPAVALRWWLFEGENYLCLREPNGDLIRLSQGWEEVAREIKKLRQHYNPRLKVVDHPGEPVDWPRTYALGAGGTRLREYVVQSSARGLSDTEWAALCGWVRWISGEWQRFKREGKGFGKFTAETQDLFDAGIPLDSGMTRSEQLRLHDKWLRTSLRSRWPLLRHLVAESLRCFSPVGPEMDQIPLPTTGYHLFELLGMVRVMKALHPKPEALNWMEGKNSVSMGGQTFQLHQSWTRESVILNAYSEAGLDEKIINTFGLRVHNIADLLILQPGHSSSFDAIIVEFKSGSQDFSYALHQLRVYQRMAQQENWGRLVLWGIVENPKEGHTKFDNDKRFLIEQKTKADFQKENVWVFSSADPGDIREVLSSLSMLPNDAIPET